MKRKRLKYRLVEWNHSHREKKKPRVCPLPVLRAEGGGSRWPDARWACSGMVYGLRAKQKKPKRGGSVSMFLSNLPKFPHGRPDSDFFFFFFRRSCWFLQARCQRWYEERAALSPAVNPRDWRWATERHLWDIWYCIFQLGLWAQVHHHHYALAQL